MGGDHRPAVWAEILTKYAGLSSKITLGEDMTSMGDIRPTATAWTSMAASSTRAPSAALTLAPPMRYDRGRQSLDRRGCLTLVEVRPGPAAMVETAVTILVR